MEPTIKAIETVYRGYKYRSRLEARWAVFFDTLGIKYEYEKEGYDLGEAGWYLPDFFLGDRIFAEIKPRIAFSKQNVYLAGKIDPDWRRKIHFPIGGIVGPSLSCKHSCALHRQFMGNNEPLDTLNSCLSDINNADIVFAWINSTDCFGTLAEIGFAHAMKKRIWIAIDRSLAGQLDTEKDYGERYDTMTHDNLCHAHDMWFIQAMSEKFGWFSNPQDALDKWAVLPPEVVKCLKLSEEFPVILIQGEPYLESFSVLEFNNGMMTSDSDFFSFMRYESGECVKKDAPFVINAYNTARQARFEHGANGRSQP